MTNAAVFKQYFGIYATELWVKNHDEFIEWINAEYKPEAISSIPLGKEQIECNLVLNRAVKGLSCCILRDPDDKPRCTECPYDGACGNRLKQDALYLLERQQNDIRLLYGGYIENTIRIAHMFNKGIVDLPVWAITEMVNTLKAQQPHIMTPEEVSEVKQGEAVWYESRISKVCEPFIRRGNDFKNDLRFLLLDEVMSCDDYLKDYRCWNLKPSQEQMLHSPWKAEVNHDYPLL